MDAQLGTFINIQRNRLILRKGHGRLTMGSNIGNICVMRTNVVAAGSSHAVSQVISSHLRAESAIPCLALDVLRSPVDCTAPRLAGPHSVSSGSSNPPT